MHNTKELHFWNETDYILSVEENPVLIDEHDQSKITIKFHGSIDNEITITRKDLIEIFGIIEEEFSISSSKPSSSMDDVLNFHNKFRNE